MKVCIGFILLLLVLVSSAFAQKTPAELAVAAYKSGDVKGAESYLKDAVKNAPTDNEAWYMLGLCQLRLSKPKDAAKAFKSAVALKPAVERYRVGLAYSLMFRNEQAEAAVQASEALKLNPKSIDALYILGTLSLLKDDPDAAYARVSAIHGIDPNFRNAYQLRADILLFRFGNLMQTPKSDRSARAAAIQEAGEAMSKFIALAPKDENVDELKKKLATINNFAGYFAFREALPESADISSPKVLKKFPVQYTDAARMSGIEGNVLLLVLFGEDAKVKDVIAVKSLGFGLDEGAEKAARKIQFEPAMLDGKPVPSARLVEYSFTIR